LQYLSRLKCENCAVQFVERPASRLIAVHTGADEYAGWCLDSRERRDECSLCRQRTWSVDSRSVDHQAPIFSTKQPQLYCPTMFQPLQLTRPFR